MSSMNGNGTNNTSTTTAVDNNGINDRNINSHDYAYTYDGASHNSNTSRRLSTIEEDYGMELPPGFVPMGGIDADRNTQFSPAGGIPGRAVSENGSYNSNDWERVSSYYRDSRRSTPDHWSERERERSRGRERSYSINTTATTPYAQSEYDPRKPLYDPYYDSYHQALIPLHHVLYYPEQLFDPVDPYSRQRYNNKRAKTHSYLHHLFDQVLRQLYSHMLLTIPSMYFTRVSRVFRDAGISKVDLKRLTGKDRNVREMSGRLRPFKAKWEMFVHGVIKEWKTLNVVSVLLLSALLTMLQIGDAASDPITRTAILLSLVCALMSLSYGCIYIVRFGTMTNMYKAAGFAQDIKRRRTSILWNVLVLLAMPAVWLAWSMFFFCVSVMSYVWTAGSKNDDTTLLGTRAEFGPRAAVTAVFCLGCVYFALIVSTFRSYRVEPDGFKVNLDEDALAQPMPLPVPGGPVPMGSYPTIAVQPPMSPTAQSNYGFNYPQAGIGHNLNRPSSSSPLLYASTSPTPTMIPPPLPMGQYPENPVMYTPLSTPYSTGISGQYVSPGMGMLQSIPMPMSMPPVLPPGFQIGPGYTPGSTFVRPTSVSRSSASSRSSSRSRSNSPPPSNRRRYSASLNTAGTPSILYQSPMPYVLQGQQMHQVQTQSAQMRGALNMNLYSSPWSVDQSALLQGSSVPGSRGHRRSSSSSQAPTPIAQPWHTPRHRRDRDRLFSANCPASPPAVPGTPWYNVPSSYNTGTHPTAVPLPPRADSSSIQSPIFLPQPSRRVTFDTATDSNTTSSARSGLIPGRESVRIEEIAVPPQPVYPITDAVTAQGQNQYADIYARTQDWRHDHRVIGGPDDQQGIPTSFRGGDDSDIRRPEPTIPPSAPHIPRVGSPSPVLELGEQSTDYYTSPRFGTTPFIPHLNSPPLVSPLLWPIPRPSSNPSTETDSPYSTPPASYPSVMPSVAHNRMIEPSMQNVNVTNRPFGRSSSPNIVVQPPSRASSVGSILMDPGIGVVSPGDRQEEDTENQPQFRPSSELIPNTNVPTPIQMPPALNEMLDMSRQSRFAQTAMIDQQREIMRYLRSLNEWLDQDAHDRHSELRSVTSRVDALRDDMARLNVIRPPPPPSP